MSDYRTPEEDREQVEQEARVRAALDQTVRDAAMLMVAMELGEPFDVVELWVDRTWDGLRDALDPEDRLTAILLLLNDRIDAEADAILRSVRGVGRA